MVWLLTKAFHTRSINGWVRQWLKGSSTDRLIQASLPGIGWAFLWGIIGFAGNAEVLFFTIGLAPWYFWALDAVVDYLHTNGGLNRLMARDDIVLATRAECVGGHPMLPHGRFAYVVLAGNRQNPSLTILYPGQENDEKFEIPLLDISELSPKSEHEESLTQQVFEPLLAKLTERPGRLFSPERVTLNVGYRGLGGRVHMVETHELLQGQRRGA
jgi:hypothetical protein